MTRTVKALLIFLVCVGLGLPLTFFARRKIQDFNAPLTRREMAMEKMGQYLAQHYRGKKVLVISNPFTQLKGRPKEIYAYEEAGIRGLRRGLGQDSTIEAIVYPELRPEYHSNPRSVYVDPHSTTPLSYLVAEEAFDVLARKHPTCEIVVSLIGLPADLGRVGIWNRAGVPRFALLLPDWKIVGGREEVREAFRTLKIVTAVINKPDAPAEAPRPAKKGPENFEERFVLVTPESVDSVTKTYPQLF